MKTLIALLFVTCTLLLVTPTASACEVEDETNLTTTCLDETSTGDPECAEDHTGSHRSTSVASDVRGFAQVGVAGTGSCYNDGWSWSESQSLTVTFTSGQTEVRVHTFDNTYSGPGFYSGGCAVSVIGHDPVTGPFGYYPVYCPFGVVPALPWGDLVPN